MTEARFIYSSHRSLAAAWLALEDMYANGDVSECERPLVEFVLGRWRVTLPC